MIVGPAVIVGPAMIVGPAVIVVPAWVTDRMLRVRSAVIVMVAFSFGIAAGGRGDWDQFVRVGRELFTGGGWHVYERHLDTQTGPITLALARMLSWTPRNGFVAGAAVCVAAGVAAIVVVERAALRRWPLTFAG